ncbi:MAG: ComEC family competence protein [Candidatus Wildermuthbacteria bacterium]|nr:ComEC family competence protein [Candidatus Wildermuthbacteria bacterium]
MDLPRFTGSSIVLISCLAVCVGIVFSSFNIFPLWAGIILCGAAFAIIALHYKSKTALAVGFGLLCFAGGYAFASFDFAGNTKSPLFLMNDAAESIVIRGKVAEAPEESANSLRVIVRPQEISRGKILVTTQKYSDIRYGDVVELRGMLESPKDFADFSYKDVLMVKKIYSTMYFPKIAVLERGDLRGINMFSGFLAEFRGELRNGISRVLPPPQSQIIDAMILGTRSVLPKDLTEDFNRTGTLHIIAISGTHVVILTGIIMYLFLNIFGLWRKHAFYFATAFIILYVILAGLQPSAVRAGIMGIVLLFGQHIGRPSVSLRALVYAAALMLLLNPLAWKDIGFQLSFLAVLGIITLSPVFQKYLLFFPKILQSIISMMLAAQVFTFPVIIYHFEYISLVSPAANLLVSFVAYPLTVLAFIFVFSTLLGSFISTVISLPLVFFLWCFVTIVKLFSKLPFASFPVEMEWTWVFLILYLPLGILAWKMRKKSQFVPYP